MPFRKILIATAAVPIKERNLKVAEGSEFLSRLLSLFLLNYSITTYINRKVYCPAGKRPSVRLPWLLDYFDAIASGDPEHWSDGVLFNHRRGLHCSFTILQRRE